MAEVVYLLCGAASFACAALLFRGYRHTRARLLLWSSLCFAGLTINNGLVFADLVIFPQLNLSLWRTGLALAAVLVMLYGLVWDSK